MTTASQRVALRNKRDRRGKAGVRVTALLAVGGIPLALWLLPYPSSLIVAIPLVVVALYLWALWR